MIESEKLCAIAETMQEGMHRMLDDQYRRISVIADTIVLPLPSDTNLVRSVLHSTCGDICLRKYARKLLERDLG